MLLNAGPLLKLLRPKMFNKSLSLLILAAFIVATAVGAQTSRPTIPQVHGVADRLVRSIDDAARVTLPNTVHPLANQANDRGAVADGLKLERLQVVLKRSEAQEADLKQLIADLHAPGSAVHGKWLTPEEFGQRFGPSEADVAKLTGWLQSHGFSVLRLNPGRQTLEISGSAGQFREAFKAQIHTYEVKGAGGLERHSANAVNPQIPAALAPIFGGFASLNNFRAKSYSHRLGAAGYNRATHESKAEWTMGSSGNVFLPLAPGDFAVQYSLPNQATAGTNDGTGTSIAIVNDSNINLSLVNRFRTLFGLPVNAPQVVIDGNDPGVDGINNPDGPNGHSGEAYLDVEWAGAVAPGATINLVVGGDTELGSGLLFGAERAVYSNLSPVISLSFGGCEAALGSTNAFFNGLWEQAAAQGITVLVSSGDSGSATCDTADQAYAVYGQAVNGYGSTPYNLSVGGTDFYYVNGTSDYGTYWNLTPSNAMPVVSLLKQVPEQPWNDSQYGMNIFDYYEGHQNTTIAAAGGGGSNCITQLNSVCSEGYAKPTWQKGTGVPSDGVRDLPDVSLFASNGANDSYYPVCQSDGDCEPADSSGVVQITGVGGTSASTPSFAGVMALVNQQYGRQGQAGFVLYPLAAQFPAAFHDVQVGTNTVPCNIDTVTGTIDGTTYQFPPSNCQTVSSPLTGTDVTYGTSSEGEIGFSTGVAAYSAGTGYDLASGLGTVNVSTLLADWGKVTFASTAVTLSVTPPSGATLATIPHGSTVTVTGAVTGTGTPTGDVAVMTNSPGQAQQGLALLTLVNGAYSGTFSGLPGGTYNVYGNYGGDSANAPSSSIANQVQVTVVPEASTTTLSLTSGYSIGVPSATPSSVMYGQQVLLSATPKPSDTSHTSTTAPTGTVVFKDGGTTIDTALLNVEGGAEFYGAYAPGSHQIVAAYSGDNSYSASNSATGTFMVTADTPTFIGPVYSNLNTDQTALLPGQQALIIGVANADADGNLVPSRNAVAPAGTLSMTGGPAGATTSVTLAPAVDPYTGTTEGIGTFVFPGNTNGTYTLKFTYTPSNATYYNGIVSSINVPFNAAGSGLLTSTTSVSAIPAAASPAGAVQVTTTISGPSGKPAPSGTISFYTSDTNFGSFELPTGSGNSTTATVLFDSTGLLPGTNPITVQYSGDGTYAPSVGSVTVSNPLSDFQMVPATTLISTGTNGTATDTIQVRSTNSFAGPVALSCKAAGGVTCSLGAASTTLAAGAQNAVTLTVGSAAVTKAGTYNVVVTGSDSTGNYVHTLGFQVVVPQVSTAMSFTLSGLMNEGVTAGAAPASTLTVTPTNGFTGTVALTCAVTGPTGATSVPTCGLQPASVILSVAAAATSLTVTTQTTTTPGDYTVTVTGTSGATVETESFVLTVSAAAGTGGIMLTATTPITVASQGASATSTVTVAPTNGFTGSVAVTCAVTASPAGATELPMCAVTPASVNVTSAAAVPTTLSVNTTAQTTGALRLMIFGGSGVTMAGLLLLGGPLGRRGRLTLKAVKTLRILSAGALFALIAGAVVGCGSGSHNSGGGGGTPTGGTTTGAYTVTLTATPATGSPVTTTVAVTVQ